jgi:hypothetical protein
LPELAVAEYPAAVKHAAFETGLAPNIFPSDMPFTVAQLLDEDFIP